MLINTDVYLEFPGASELQGDSNDDKHANQIELSSIEMNVYQPISTNLSSSGNHATSRVIHDPIVVVKELDKSSPKILKAVSAGTSYNKAILHFYRPVGGTNTTATTNNRQKYLQIDLTDVLLSRYTVDMGRELPQEKVGLSYGSILMTYIKTNSDGTSSNTGSGGWSTKNNKPL